jgi:twitching motility two-component system response regulator PilH
MKFLVIDDSAVDRHLLTSVLEGMGHQVDTCNDTTGALDQITDRDYAAVFLDIVMPEKDGYKFLRELRSNDKTAKQHVIFCSSKKTTIEIDYGISSNPSIKMLSPKFYKKSYESCPSFC